MNERIRKIREEADLNQANFGAKIGITGSAVSLIEGGKREPSEMVIRAICQIFGISRKWLDTGKGEMRIAPDNDNEIVDEVLSGDDEFVKAVIRGIAKTPGGWEKMREVFTAIQNELQKNPPKD